MTPERVLELVEEYGFACAQLAVALRERTEDRQLEARRTKEYLRSRLEWSIGQLGGEAACESAEDR